MNQTTSAPARWPLIAAALIAIAVGFLIGRMFLDQPTPFDANAPTQWPEPKPLAPFELVSDSGKSFTNSALADRWSLVFFGYTHCPDVCPTTLSYLNNVAGKLAKDHTLERPLQVLFVSVDPQRDTPAQLGEYVRYFNPSFTGLTGSDSQLEAFARQLGSIYMRIAGSSETDYLMDHSSHILLVDPKGRLSTLFRTNHSVETITAAIAHLDKEF